MKTDPRNRFSTRTEYYDRYRPRYPTAILKFLQQEHDFSSMLVMADVGSGTGILSEMFLRHGNVVFCVEPNKRMREVAEGNLGRYPNFRSIDASAEATTLPATSVDFITAAQSFHWFDTEKARIEFLRILKPAGWVILIWNTRINSTPFMHAYDRLVKNFSTESMRVRHEDIGEDHLTKFLGKHKFRVFENVQVLDLKGLEGRLLSSSYAPLPENPRHIPMMVELHRIFESFQVNGVVRLEYNTEVFCGQLTQ